MKNQPEDECFYRMVGKRMGFTGQISALMIWRDKRIRLTVQDVHEKDGGRYFRDHAHCFIRWGDYRRLLDEGAVLGDHITFSAVVSRYKKRIGYRKQIERICYGLTNAKKFKREERGNLWQQ